MKKLEALVIALNDLNRENKESQEQYKFQKQNLESKLQKEFAKSKEVENNSYSFKNDQEFIKATFVQPKKVVFNPEKLEEKLDKEITQQVIKKQYRILDYEGMVEYLKSLGAKPKDFKQFIFCDKEVDSKKIENLSDLGEINEEDLEGTYTVNNLSSYFKITTSEIETEDE